ncbi:MAG: hypothetical protein Alpg2KO_18060 [Alphaproteobacteria bacterium]
MADKTSSSMPLRKRGASLSGYGLIVGLISVLALTAITQSGRNVNELFNTTSGALGGVIQSDDQQAAASPTPAADREPDAFSFDTVFSNASTADSAAVVITGIDGGTDVSISSSVVASLSVNGGSFGPGPFSINSGDTLTARLTVPSSEGQSNTMTITVGDTSEVFTVTNPDDFATGTVLNVPPDNNSSLSFPLVEAVGRPYQVTHGDLNSICQNAGFSRGAACNDVGACNHARQFRTDLRNQLNLPGDEGFHIIGCRNNSSCTDTSPWVCGYHSWGTGGSNDQWCTNNSGPTSDGTSSTRRAAGMDQVWAVCVP